MLRQPDATFDDFVIQAAPGLLRSAYRLLGDRHAAEDLLQVALVRVARNWPRASENPVAYAEKTLVNLATDRWRKYARRVREVPLEGLHEYGRVDASQHGERAELMAALRLLPPRMRAVLVLRYWEDRSTEETATLLGCSVGNVKSTSSRGLLRLRDLLSEREYVDERS